MKEYLVIDSSLSCKMRTTSVPLRAQTGGTPERQQLPGTPMPGRRLVRVLNFGRLGQFPSNPPTELHIMVGDEDVRWGSTTDATGVALRVNESIEFEVDETVPVYAVLDPTLTPPADTIDVRVLELG